MNQKQRNSFAKLMAKYVGEENVMTSEVDRYAYSYDAAVLDSTTPGIVVRPESSEALGQVVALCYENNLPITVRGAGTNLSGGTVPQDGGVVILTTKLNRIIEINEADLYAVVEPGVVTAVFAREVASRGLFYPPDPGSQAVSTLGGNVAENAGGLRGLKYGVTKDYVMGIEFFDSEGILVKSGSRTVKCATGLHLAGLLVGSEGTLGVFSEITLKLIPPPASARSMLAIFDSIQAASETVAAIIAAKIVPATLEMMDNFTIRSVDNFRHAGLPLDAAALLLIEVDGHPAQVADESEQIVQICKKNRAREIKVAGDVEEKNRIWQARRDALPALASLRPTCVLEDATVPRSKIPDMIDSLEKISQKYSLTIGTFGHAGDGNLHPTILTDRRDAKEWGRVEEAIAEIFDIAIALGGTLSGEHGIGLAKAKFLKNECGVGNIHFSRKLKVAMDPKNIFNPGKIF